METEVIGEAAIGESSTIKVWTFVGKDGRKRVDIRLFVAGDKYTGPTKKGCSFPIEKLPELISILQKAK